MKKNSSNKRNITTLKVVNKKDLSSIYGGLEQSSIESSLSAQGLTSIAHDIDAGGLCSIFKDQDF